MARWLGRRCPRTFLAVAGAVLLMGCAPFIGLDRFAGSLGTAGASSSVPTITLGAPGTPANRFNVDSTGLGPGDSSQRVLDIATRSSRQFALTLQITVTKSSLLDRDRVKSAAFRYSCAGHISTVLGSRALAVVKSGKPIVLRLTSGASTQHLRLRVILPPTAKNSFQGLTTVLKLEITATSSR